MTRLGIMYGLAVVAVGAIVAIACSPYGPDVGTGAIWLIRGWSVSALHRWWQPGVPNTFVMELKTDDPDPDLSAGAPAALYPALPAVLACEDHEAAKRAFLLSNPEAIYVSYPYFCEPRLEINVLSMSALMRLSLNARVRDIHAGLIKNMPDDYSPPTPVSLPLATQPIGNDGRGMEYIGDVAPIAVERGHAFARFVWRRPVAPQTLLELCGSGGCKGTVNSAVVLDCTTRFFAEGDSEYRDPRSGFVASLYDPRPIRPFVPEAGSPLRKAGDALCSAQSSSQ